MNRSDFSKQIDRLKSQFGKQHYSPERLALMFDEFKSVDVHTFESAISRCIRDRSKPPLAKDINMVISEIRDKLWGETKKQEQEDSKLAISRLQGEAKFYKDAAIDGLVHNIPNIKEFLIDMASKLEGELEGGIGQGKGP